MFFKKKSPTIKTERLVLRAITMKDADAMFQCSKDFEVGLNAGWEAHPNVKYTKKILRQIFINQKTIWGIVLINTNTFVGSAGLLPDATRDNKNALMLGYALGKKYWGKGIMTEAAKAIIKYAFENLPIDIISVTHYPENKRSESVIKKCEFKKEGTIRNAEIRFDGKVKDKIIYSLKKEEYLKLIKKFT